MDENHSLLTPDFYFQIRGQRAEGSKGRRKVAS